jgi:hypothetical protein
VPGKRGPSGRKEMQKQIPLPSREQVSSSVFTSFKGFNLCIKQEMENFVYGNIAKIRVFLRKTKKDGAWPHVQGNDN